MQEWKLQPYGTWAGSRGGLFPLVVAQLLSRGVPRSSVLGTDGITHPSIPLCCCISPQLVSC